MKRAEVTDSYAKPWVPEDAAKNLVKSGSEKGYTPAQMISEHYGLYRPDYAAVVGRFAAVNFHEAPKRSISPEEIGVTGFAPEGHIFPLAQVWQQVTGENVPAQQSFSPVPDEHLESQYEDMVSGGEEF